MGELLDEEIDNAPAFDAICQAKSIADSVWIAYDDGGAEFAYALAGAAALLEGASHSIDQVGPSQRRKKTQRPIGSSDELPAPEGGHA